MESVFSIALPTRLGIANVTAFREELSGAFDQNQAIEIGADAVERVDAAGLQLLFAFVAAAQSRGQKVEIKEPSSVFTQTVAMLGLSEALGVEA